MPDWISHPSAASPGGSKEDILEQDTPNPRTSAACSSMSGGGPSSSTACSPASSVLSMTPAGEEQSSRRSSRYSGDLTAVLAEVGEERDEKADPLLRNAHPV